MSADGDVMTVHSCHTEYALDAAFAHAPARAPSRQIEIAGCRCQLFLTVLCGVARSVQAVLQQPAHVFVTCLTIFWRQLNRNTLLSAGALKYALRTSTNATTFPPSAPKAITDNATFSASSGGVQLWPRVRLVCLRARWASLVVPCQSPPILSRWLPSPSHASTPLREPSCTSCGDGCTPLLHVLPWRTAPGRATHRSCHPNAILPTDAVPAHRDA